MEKLLKLMKTLADEKSNTLKRREYWQSNLKDLLISQLKYYVKEIKSDWYVDVNDSKINYNTISLAFRNLPSGIYNPGEGKQYMLIGGALHFSQLYNGKIFVWIEYPYIEEISFHESPYKDLAVFNPEDLSEDVILKHIESFIEIIIESESKERKMIGFQK